MVEAALQDSDGVGAIFPPIIYTIISLHCLGHSSETPEMKYALKQLDDEIPRLEGEVDFLKIQNLSRDEVVEEARDLYSRWPELPKDDKRKVEEFYDARFIPQCP